MRLVLDTNVLVTGNRKHFSGVKALGRQKVLSPGELLESFRS